MSLSRTEYKFLISNEQREQLEAEISRRFADDDSLRPEGQYPIVSQYYDSPDRACYWEKVRGLGSRRKIRVRMYGSEDARIPPAAFIEVKHKLAGEGGKRRLQIPVDTARRFADGEHNVIKALLPDANRADRILILEVIDLIDRCSHGPSMQIRYDRIAYTTPDSKFRITFDTNLYCRSGKHSLQPDDRTFSDEILDRNTVMMEVKSIGYVPYWFRGWNSHAALSRQSFSKYCTAVEKFDPILRKTKAP